MKSLIVAASLLTIGTGVAPAADWSLSWLRTRPKPVVVNADPVVKPARVEYRGKTSYSAAGRLYFESTARERPAVQRSKPRAWKIARQ